MLHYPVAILRFVSFSKPFSELRIHLLLWGGGMQRSWDALTPPQRICGWTCALALPLPDFPSISLLIFITSLCFFHPPEWFQMWVLFLINRTHWCPTCFLPPGPAAVRGWLLCHVLVVLPVRGHISVSLANPCSHHPPEGLMGG